MSRRSHGASVLRREGRSGYALVAPTTILLAIFYLFPPAETAYYSFTDWNPISAADAIAAAAKQAQTILANKAAS